MIITLRSRRIAVAALALACGDTTAPPARTGVSFIAGNNQADSVSARLPDALVVEIRDSQGVRLTGEPVLFDALPIDTGPVAPPSVEIGRISSPFFGASVTDTTGATGRAAVLVQLGGLPGVGMLRVTVPRLGFTDTARFVIAAGAPANVTGEPADTALYIGRSLSLRVRVTDRLGNPRSDTVAYLALGTAVRVAGGVVTGQEIGRGSVAMSVAGIADTARVSVVPVGTIAATSSQWGIVVVNLDGSGFRVIYPPYGGCVGSYPTWAVPPTAIVFSRGCYPTTSLAIMTPGDTARAVLVAGDSGIQEQAWPSFSRDGAWVYFVGYRFGRPKLWRVRPTGIDLERLIPDDTTLAVDYYPSPSPGGDRVAFATSRTTGGTPLSLAVLYLPGGQIAPRASNAEFPRWAPTGDTIAYQDYGGGAVHVIGSEGSGHRVVSPQGEVHYMGLDWSPDGRWIVSHANSRLVLLEVQTGRSLPLPFSELMYYPSWRP